MFRAVKLRFPIRHFFAALAVAGLVLSPIAHPVMAMPMITQAPMDEAKGMTDAMSAAMPMDMPCCPEKSSGLDCGKDCPFMTLCSAKTFQSVAFAGLIVPLTPVSILVPGNQTELSSIAQTPPRRPPKI
jgi:hypothetical protein